MTVSAARDDRHHLYGALRRLLFLVPPERSHHLVFAALRGLTTTAPVRRLVLLFNPPPALGAPQRDGSPG